MSLTSAPGGDISDGILAPAARSFSGEPDFLDLSQNHLRKPGKIQSSFFLLVLRGSAIQA
jgi:hypothetical protein